MTATFHVGDAIDRHCSDTEIPCPIRPGGFAMTATFFVGDANEVMGKS